MCRITLPLPVLPSSSPAPSLALLGQCCLRRPILHFLTALTYLHSTLFPSLIFGTTASFWSSSAGCPSPTAGRRRRGRGWTHNLDPLFLERRGRGGEKEWCGGRKGRPFFNCGLWTSSPPFGTTRLRGETTRDARNCLRLAAGERGGEDYSERYRKKDSEGDGERRGLSLQGKKCCTWILVQKD